MTLTMTSFITGSQVYGKPNENSDVDLVVLINKEEVELLKKTCDRYTEWYEREGDCGRYTYILHSISIHFGKLNLICVFRESIYNIWLQATNSAASKRDITTEIMDSLLTSLRGYRVYRKEDCK